ncbi:protein of unknown function [Candidatus Nitrosotalea okcheonensis]|uniref:Uncharacterized protein n=1 Tax=Candidatus Nitrosotalea okcheonensis TaxID=1903276 RepID=A0A2H1FH72_9ARCH|nr:protein of unknown function [Candidatus Nitrosotalea okcheonensis]
MKQSIFWLLRSAGEQKSSMPEYKTKIMQPSKRFATTYRQGIVNK